MCKKCEIFHSKLCKIHQTKILWEFEGNKEEIFPGFYKEERHNIELEYFCKNYNKLCCPACLCKIKNKRNGEHKDYEVCNLEDLKDIKINKLKEKKY